jgi:3D (Asp-Asp-Asp) domain-containing protein
MKIFSKVPNVTLEVLAAVALITAISGATFPALQAQAESVESNPTYVSFGALSPAQEREAARTYTIPMTAYNSLPGQTDDTPYTTAMQTPTRHGVVAANFLPLGTRVKIPELYGDEIFIVEDRMNARYNLKMDIWMDDLGDARQFGLKTVTIEVFPGK